MNQSRFKTYLPHTLPFLVFAGFTYATPWLPLSQGLSYGLKTLSVLVLLILFFPIYRMEIRPFFDKNAILAGMMAFIFWVGLEGKYPLVGTPSGFNPGAAGSHPMVWAGIRLFGACMVVPVMEELFWRSFALRFLMDKDFSQIPLGHFSWFSFIAVSFAFGFEHHRWLPGILTGMLYAVVLYQRKNLFSPILAHGVTNFLLGIYVIANQSWEFW